ncbi:MAG TPA: helix-turn-helix transcriptional regulator [Flavitalea sp.]|nr:helix-turn-helix transcriptional regulator [Flavitalea sp.]
MAQIRDDKLLLSIALVLKELREDRGVSQQEVYLETNIHIGRIETCKLNPSVCTMFVLLKYFRIKMSEFYLKVEKRKLITFYDDENE